MSKKGEPPLLGDSDDFLSRWQAIQVAFVDEPTSAVQDADSLVAELMQRLAESFATERDRLEKQWSAGHDTDTEEPGWRSNATGRSSTDC